MSDGRNRERKQRGQSANRRGRHSLEPFSPPVGGKFDIYGTARLQGGASFRMHIGYYDASDVWHSLYIYEGGSTDLDLSALPTLREFTMPPGSRLAFIANAHGNGTNMNILFGAVSGKAVGIRWHPPAGTMVSIR